MQNGFEFQVGIKWPRSFAGPWLWAA